MTDATSSDALRTPSFLRNRDPILAVLTRVLPEHGTVLEIASGSGEHAVYLGLVRFLASFREGQPC